MPNLLDVDPSILQRNLLFKDIQEDEGDMSSDSLFNIKPKDPDDIPWKPVKPNPGYCVKLRSHEGDKVFVNVCHTDAIPEPVDISEEKLLEMIMDDDVPTFRIPISIGELHIESDKSRNPCSVFDIAVNSKFFKKMDSSEVFNTFFLNVSIQALQEKYSLDLDLKSEKPFLLLKNRKALGNLQVHRIQQREVKKAPGQLIQEIASKPTEKNLIEVVSETQNHDISSASSQINQPVPTSSQQSSKQKGNISIRNELDRNQLITDQKPLNIEEEKYKSSAGTSMNEESKTVLASEDSEKGMKENRLTKDYVETERSRLNVDKREEASLAAGHFELGKHHEMGQGEGSDNCSGLFCLKQYPETGFPQLLIASLRLNVKWSKDFDLELDTNRVTVTVNGNKKPWFDVFLPYNIDVNKVEACFVTQSQKLLIKMDVMKI